MEYDVNEEDIRNNMKNVLLLCSQSSTLAGEAAIRNSVSEVIFYSSSAQNNMLTLMYYQNMLITNELTKIKCELRELRGI